jgi:hypothetical protein
MRSFGIDSNRFTSKSITKSITSRVTRGRITVSKSAAVFGDTLRMFERVAVGPVIDLHEQITFIDELVVLDVELDDWTVDLRSDAYKVCEDLRVVRPRVCAHTMQADGANDECVHNDTDAQDFPANCLVVDDSFAIESSLNQCLSGRRSATR